MLKKFILISVIPLTYTKEQAQEDLEEIESLTEALRGVKVVEIIQRRMHPDPGTYIGKGKAVEVAEKIKNGEADIVVINALVSPRQLFNIRKLFWDKRPEGEVWDRVDLILHVFRQHAQTAEAKLQIELATMRHMGPRMFGLGGSVLSRQGGGIGTKGIGETNIERMKRHWREEMRKVQKQLTKLENARKLQLKRRKEVGLKTVSIVGYTNAGKSTLFNALTHKEKLVKDMPFATLDSATGKLRLPDIQKDVLVSDTIGFIQKLPPSLISAFKSTLMESVHADILLHVIDASDPKMWEKVAVVESILNELKVQAGTQIYVFNKIDKPTSLKKSDIEFIFRHYQSRYPHFISARTGQGIDKLIQTIRTLCPSFATQ